jgi:hypothetical protein
METTATLLPASWLWVTGLAALILCLSAATAAVALVVVALQVRQAVLSTKAHIDPLIDQVGRITDCAAQTVEVVGEHAQRIANAAEKTATRVTTQADEAVAMFRRELLEPMVGIAATTYGARKAWEIWQEFRKKRTS